MSRDDSLGVAVPAGVGWRFIGTAIPVDLHQPDPGLYQSAGQEHALAERSSSIAGPVDIGLFLQAECPTGLRRTQEIERLARLLVKRPGQRATIEGAEFTFDSAQQVLPSAETTMVNIGW